MLDIISIGSAVKDVFLISKDFKLLKSAEFETGVGECFAYGAKVDIADLHMDTGGGATNSAATFANLGLKAGIFTVVGHDVFGDEIVRVMSQRGINIKNLSRHPRLKTGYSTILLSPKGERTILVYRGASNDFITSQLDAGKLRSKWFYLTGVAGNLRFAEKVFSIAVKNKTKVFWNPGGGELRQGIAKLKSLIGKAEVFSLNKEEASELTGKSDVTENLGILGQLARFVWITDGKVGAYLRHNGNDYFLPSLGTPAINVTGAGDAFGSGFAAGMMLKNNWEFAARLAILNSDGVIRKMGAKTGLLKKIPSTAQLAKVKINMN